VQGPVQIGGATFGDSNTIIASSHQGIQILSSSASAIQITNNSLTSQTAGIDVSGGTPSLTVLGNDIVAHSVAAVSVSNTTGGSIVIGGVGFGDGNTITAFPSGSGVVLSNVTGNVSIIGNAMGNQTVSAPLNGVNADTISGDLTISGNLIISNST